MRWQLLLALLGHLQANVAAFSTARKVELRELTRRTWQHGWRNYMEHAFPADEVRISLHDDSE